MAVPTRAAFLIRFPEFGEQPTSLLDEVLAEAGRATSVDLWGTVHTEAVSYLAAHLLATRTIQLGLQVGSVSGSPTGSGYEATLYGQEYKRLLGSRPLSGFAF